MKTSTLVALGVGGLILFAVAKKSSAAPMLSDDEAARRQLWINYYAGKYKSFGSSSAPGNQQLAITFLQAWSALYYNQIPTPPGAPPEILPTISVQPPTL